MLERIHIRLLLVFPVAVAAGALRPSRPAYAATANLPESETTFCAFLQEGVTAYAPLLRQWESAQDPDARKLARSHMASLRIERDKAIFDLLRKSAFHIAEWQIQTPAKALSHLVDAGGGNWNVTVHANLPCPTPATIDTTLTVSPAVLSLFQDSSKDTVLRVSGSFVPRENSRYPPESLVWSPTEAGAMNTPNYRLDIMSFRIITGF